MQTLMVVESMLMGLNSRLTLEAELAVRAVQVMDIFGMSIQGTLRSEFTAAVAAPNRVCGFVVLSRRIFVDKASITCVAVWPMLLLLMRLQLILSIKDVRAIVAFPKPIVIFCFAVLADRALVAEVPLTFVALIVHGEVSRMDDRYLDLEKVSPFS